MFNPSIARAEDSPPRVGSESSPPKELLSTRANVLLTSREMEFSVGFSYEKRDDISSLRQIRQRQFEIPITASIGLSSRLNMFLSVPFIYQSEELLTIEDTDTNNIYGFGDIVTGLSVQLLEENDDRPNVSTTLSVNLPTGSQLGSGKEHSDVFTSDAYGSAVQINVSKSLDPAVLNVSLGYRQDFSNAGLSTDFQSGRSFNYSVGAGFSVNSALLFNARMNGSYNTQSERRNEPLPGSSSEPVSVNLSMSYRLNRRWRLESGVNFGLNEDAGDSSLSFDYVWNRRPE